MNAADRNRLTEKLEQVLNLMNDQGLRQLKIELGALHKAAELGNTPIRGRGVIDAIDDFLCSNYVHKQFGDFLVAEEGMMIPVDGGSPVNKIVIVRQQNAMTLAFDELGGLTLRK